MLDRIFGLAQTGTIVRREIEPGAAVIALAFAAKVALT
jgi:hypothetical protein